MRHITAFISSGPQAVSARRKIDASSFERMTEGRAKLFDMTARLYNANGSSYRQIRSKEAIVDERLGTLTYGPELKTVVKLSATTN